MSVKDHGLEALRKSAREIVEGNKAEYELRVANDEIKSILEQIRDQGPGGGSGGQPSGSILSGIKYDQVTANYPTSTTEVYQYFFNSALVATVSVSYTDATKKVIQSLVRT